MMYRKWISQGVKKSGKSAIGLANALGVHRSAVYKMITGKRHVNAEELPAIAKYIEEPVPNSTASVASGELLTVGIERTISDGVWFEADADLAGGQTIQVPRNHEFQNVAPVAFTFHGHTMGASGILDGDVLICIPAGDMSSLDDGKIVIIKREKAGLTQYSARIVKLIDDKAELATDPLKGDAKPITIPKKLKATLGGETVTVVAIVRRVTREIK